DWLDPALDLLLLGRQFQGLLGLCGLRVPLAHPVVALLLELLDQLRTAVLDNLATEEDVHELGLDVGQNSLVVSDDQDAGRVPGRNPIDPLGNDPYGVDVQAAVGLVEYREGRAQHGELEDLGALLLASGETLVE